MLTSSSLQLGKISFACNYIPLTEIDFASRFRNAREIANELCEPSVTEQVGPVWGLDADGELRSVWRSSGHPQLYFAAGKNNFFCTISK